MHTVFYSICSKCPPFACTHAGRHLRHSLIALSMMLWSTLCHICCTTLFQFVSVVHPRLVHSMLDDAPDPVINRIKVRAGQRSGGMNVGFACWRSCTVQCRMPSVLGRSPVERRIPLIPRALVAALTGEHHGSMRR